MLSRYIGITDTTLPIDDKNMACEKSTKTKKDMSEKILQHPFFPFSHLSKDCLKPQFFRHQLQVGRASCAALRKLCAFLRP